MPAPLRSTFQYAIVRVLPRVERGECLNVGVILLCRARRYLGARIALDERRLAAGPIARLGQAERFHWLVAPASTIIQTSEVHSGLCDDPAAELDHLVATLVD